MAVGILNYDSSCAVEGDAAWAACAAVVLDAVVVAVDDYMVQMQKLL